MDDLELTSLIQERDRLVLQRIGEIAEEAFGDPAWEAYFHAAARLLLRAEEIRRLAEKDGAYAAEALRALSALLEREVLSDAYAECYANPAFCAAKLGGRYGRLMCAVYYEMLCAAGFACGNRREDVTIRMELFAEIHTEFAYERQESGRLPEYETVRRMLYWFVWDYCEEAAAEAVSRLVGQVPFAAAGAAGEAGTEAGEVWPDRLEADGAAGGAWQDRPETDGEAAFPRLLEEGSILYDGLRRGEGLPPVPARRAGEMLSPDAWEREGAPQEDGQTLLRKSLLRCRHDHGEDRALLLDRSYVSRRIEVLETAVEKSGIRTDAPALFGRTPDEKHLTEGQRQLWQKYLRKTEELFKKGLHV